MAVTMVNGSARASNVLHLEKLYNAPREDVFSCWTEKEKLKEWWGPHGFTNPLCEVDVKAGGYIHIDMQSADGIIFPMKGKYIQIIAPKQLIFFTSAFEDEVGQPQLQNTNIINFLSINNATQLIIDVVTIISSKEVEEALESMELGWKQSLDKLEQLLKASLQ